MKYTASFVTECYDILNDRVITGLPAAEREIALLAIIARARQGLDDMGRLPADVSAVLDTRADADAWHTDLPDDELTVLVAAPALSGEPIAAFRVAGAWLRSADHAIIPDHHVTAWRELPALPETLPAIVPGTNPARIV